jgi:RNA-binding protein
MTALTSKQRQYLKGLGHPLSPLVRIGKAGLTEGVIAEARKALESHELIKVRIDVDEGSERKKLAADLATATDAQLVSTVGKTALIYREREEEPEIRLPK